MSMSLSLTEEKKVTRLPISILGCSERDFFVYIYNTQHDISFQEGKIYENQCDNSGCLPVVIHDTSVWRLLQFCFGVAFYTTQQMLH